MAKKRLVSPPLKIDLSSEESSCVRVVLRYLTSRSTAAVRRPEYWATTVPAAIPANPITMASTMLMRMFIPLTTRSVVIGLTLSCMPMNQPFRAIRLSVAGAAHIRMKKY